MEALPRGKDLEEKTVAHSVESLPRLYPEDYVSPTSHWNYGARQAPKVL